MVTTTTTKKKIVVPKGGADLRSESYLRAVKAGQEAKGQDTTKIDRAIDNEIARRTGSGEVVQGDLVEGQYTTAAEVVQQARSDPKASQENLQKLAQAKEIQNKFLQQQQIYELQQQGSTMVRGQRVYSPVNRDVQSGAQSTAGDVVREYRREAVPLYSTSYNPTERLGQIAETVEVRQQQERLSRELRGDTPTETIVKNYNARGEKDGNKLFSGNNIFVDSSNNIQLQEETTIEKRKREFQTAGEYLRIRKEAGTITTKERFAQIPTGAGYVGLGAYYTAQEIITNPFQSIKGVGQFLSLGVRPKELVKEGISLGTSFKEQPIFTIGSFAGQTAVFAGATKVVKSVKLEPTTIPQKFKTPTNPYETSPESITYKTLSISLPSGKSLIIGSISDTAFSTPRYVYSQFKEVFVDPIVQSGKIASETPKEFYQSYIKEPLTLPLQGVKETGKEVFVDPIVQSGKIASETPKEFYQSYIKEPLTLPLQGVKETGKEVFVDPIVQSGRFIKEEAAYNTRVVTRSRFFEEVSDQYSNTKNVLFEPVKSVSKLASETSLDTLNMFTPEGVSIGTPDITPALRNARRTKPQKDLIKLGSASETKIFKRALANLDETEVVSYARSQEGISTLRDLILKTRYTKSTFITEFPKQTERLPEAGTKIALDLARKDKGILTGSFSRQPELATEFNINGEPYNLNKAPRDIDIHLDYPKEVIFKKARETVIKLREVGVSAKVKDGNTIYVKQQSGKYEKAIELLNDRELVKLEEQVPDRVLGFEKVGKRTKLEGITKSSLNEELRGVTQGISRVRIDEKIDLYPPEKRVKDIGSVYVSSLTLERSKLFPSATLRNAISKFENLYPKELVFEQLKAAPIENKVLADFSVSKPNKITSFVTSNSITKENNKPSNSLSRSNTQSNSISSSRSQSISLSKSPSVSRSPSRSVSPSISISPSISTSRSPSRSLSPSPSVSRSPSRSVSPSISISPSISTSPSPSISISPSPSVSRSPSPSISISPYPSRPPTYPPILPRRSEGYTSSSTAYTLEVKRFGKYRQVAGGLTRGRALKLGAQTVSRNLGATFRIKPTGTTTERDIAYQPSTIRFREFKVQGGRKVATPNTFIQRSSYRLSNPLERREIQIARSGIL